ncbi:thioredoxin reductase (NADPH) [Edaphobacter aggregans]|uniref:Thioredoxin reductase (NADPH) n=2 Tax=Edaphobacter aggregans TaxID=570835 RepID=A0A428MNB8_9BACT|nr:thioredoxin reductase (NADPH) [Edaphobacter aggregans]
MTDKSQDATQPSDVRVIGRAGSAMAYKIRDYLQRSDVPFVWVELENDQQARREAGVNDLHDARLPVCVFPDGTRMECPTIRQITEKLGWFRSPSLSEYDLAIYGAGPAGLSAAVYGASEGLKTVVIERSAVGGQAGTTSKIENYLGFPKGIAGADLAERAREQACRFGAEFLLSREGVSAQFLPGKTVGYLADGTKIIARSTICATGVQYRRLNLPNEQKFFGAGLYYGAGVSETALSDNDEVIVVGGGNSAGQAAMNFSGSAKTVTVVIRGDSLKSTLSHYLIDRINAASNVRVICNTEVAELHGDPMLQSVTLTNNKTGEKQNLSTKGLFICIGGVPQTDWAAQVGIMRDEAGYLVTGPDMLKEGHLPESWLLDRQPYYLETNIPGMFAAGDVRHGAVKRCASAVGEGAMAVTLVLRYLVDS